MMEHIFITVRSRGASIFVRASMFVLPFIAMAQTPTTVGGTSKLVTIACRIFEYLYGIALAVGVIYAVVAGLKYMTSGGDANKVSEAHKALTWAAIGIAVALIAIGMPGIISDLLGGGAKKACP